MTEECKHIWRWMLYRGEYDMLVCAKCGAEKEPPKGEH